MGARYMWAWFLVLLLLPAGVAFGTDPSLTAAWVEPKSITILPSSDVPVGAKVTIVCSWAQAETVNVAWGSVNHNALDAANWNLLSRIELDNKKLKDFYVPAKITGKVMTAGSAAGEWIASTPGTHNGICTTDIFRSLQSPLSHATQALFFSVKVQPLPVGATSNVPLKAVPSMGIGPLLGVLSAESAPQNACAHPSPAAIVTITVRNTGADLAAGKGTVALKEVGGTGNLAGGPVPLPAIGSNGTAVVQVPVATPDSYSTLGGSHQLAVHFTPNGPTVSARTRPFTVSVVFPSHYCGKSNRVAPVGGSAPAGSNLPAMRQPAAPRRR